MARIDQLEAKEFLIARILEQASKDGVPLSDVERMMLYFTESGWVPEGMEEAAQIFHLECDPVKYERKIAQLLSGARRRLSLTREAEWNEAVRALEGGDHYLLVMLTQSANILDWRRVRRISVLAILFVIVFNWLLGRYADWSLP